jgi:cell division septation protein DedD
MNNQVVVLDRIGLIKLGGGVTALLVLGFVAGAVVGFGAHLDTVGAAASPLTESTPAVSPLTEPTRVVSTVATDERCVEDGVAATDPVRTQSMALAVPVSSETSVSRTDATEAPAVSKRADEPAHARHPEYAVQVGVFGVDANAEALATKLRGRGYDPLVIAMRNRSGRWLKRVHLSVFENEASAVLAARAFRDREGLPAIVVDVGGDLR